MLKNGQSHDAKKQPIRTFCFSVNGYHSFTRTPFIYTVVLTSVVSLLILINDYLWKKEPSHDKTKKINVRTAKTQISLGIRPVWSESSLCAQWVAKDPSFLHADSEDWSDWADAQVDPSLRWAHNHIVGFVLSWLKSCQYMTSQTLVCQIQDVCGRFQSANWTEHVSTGHSYALV